MDLVFLIDCDLEEEPDHYSIILFATNLRCCFGIQKTRKGNIFERLSGEIALINYLSEIDMPRNILTAREQELLLAGIWHITGFNQIAVEVDKH